MKSLKSIFTLALALIVSLSVSARELNILPQPTYINIEEGDYVVTSKTRVILDVAYPNPAYRFAEDMLPICGNMKVSKWGKGIKLSVDENLPKEGYTLTTTANGITIVGGSEAGMYYGLQTLRQIIVTNKGRVPYGVIKDEPTFEYRGAHLDVARHFFSAQPLLWWVARMQCRMVDLHQTTQRIPRHHSLL